MFSSLSFVVATTSYVEGIFFFFFVATNLMRKQTCVTIATQVSVLCHCVMCFPLVSIFGLLPVLV